jgi:hypothetical protein
MAKIGIQYRKEPGEHGTWIIVESGLCTNNEAKIIEAGCTRRYRLEAIPNAKGCIMKVLDGTKPSVVTITPSTYGLSYKCVKVHGQVDPFAPVQEDGPYVGKSILVYSIKYQEVGSIV